MPSTADARARLPAARSLSTLGCDDLFPRARLALEPTAMDVGLRVKSIREGIERIRDQIGLIPPGALRDKANHDLVGLEQRLFGVTERAKRGADVGGYLGPLEVDVAGRERDLDRCRGATRSGSGTLRPRAPRSPTSLPAVTRSVRCRRRCLRDVTPAPKLGVPTSGPSVPSPPMPTPWTPFSGDSNRLRARSGPRTYARALAERRGVARAARRALDAQAAMSPAITEDERADLAPLHTQLVATPRAPESALGARGR